MGRVRSTAFIQAILLICAVTALSAETLTVHSQAIPPADQIVERMQRHEAEQSKELKHYDAVRHYRVQYKGLGTLIVATMEVEVNFDNRSGKTFRILSQSGSKLLCDKVLKRAVESEQEASKDKSSTALNPANYRFQVTGTEQLDGRPTYILQVEPLKQSKFLYRGRVWVDAVDYAVVKIDAEPAKNPSFWISRARIESANSKIDGMWLPLKTRSESKIRIGGAAVLTIDYGAYRVSLAEQSQAPASH
jgi:hypothetical protein